MEAKLAILQAVETDTIRLTHSEFHENKHRETWFFRYTVNEKRFIFRIVFTDNIVTLHSLRNEEGLDLSQRLLFSHITEKIRFSFEHSSLYRIKFALKTLEFHVAPSKNYIHEPSRIYERQNEAYILQHKETIQQIFQTCLQNATTKLRLPKRYYFIEKEVDEAPLYAFLCQHCHFEQIATLGNEKLYIINPPSTMLHTDFYESFRKAMLTLGYNLYYKLQEDDTYYYSRRASYFELNDDDDDSWEHYSRKESFKKRKNR